MGVIAKGEITLSNVNDAYTVSLTKTSCVINADYDGSNPQLGEAYTTISVKRGDKTQWFKVAVVSKTNDDIVISNASMPTDGTADTLFSSCIFRFDSVPSDALEGSATIRISTEDGYVADVVFSYTLVRESTMLDWIQEWEGNKTKIGDSSIVTPKIFVGKKITGEYTSIFDVPQLTGVYIGPSGEDGNSCGLYGYRAGEEIFHIDEAGALIGGWSIFSNGIVTSNENGSIGMYSDGTIQYLNTSGDVIWKLDNAGNATFGKGSVQIYANGDAEFSGKITSAEGQIGGWTIDDNGLASGSIRIDSKDKYVAISGATSIAETDDFLSTVIKNGGVVMQYKASNYGIKGCLPSSSAEANYCFSLGSDNFIAGWNFDADSLWSGTKNNTTGSVTTSGITIGSNGLRGVKWYIDNTGDISFMDGKIKFTASDNGGEIVGWKLNDKRFSADNIALVSDSSALGLYMSGSSSKSLNTLAASSFTSYIEEAGGLYLSVKSGNAVFAAYGTSGSLLKIQTNGVSTIAGWNFDAGMLYTGTAANSGFAPSGSITLGPTGLRGSQWRLENDGSGALAGGKISWDVANGTCTLNIEGNVTIGPGSSGLANLAEWGDVEKSIDDVQSGLSDLNYLKSAFPNSTLVTGATISQMAIVVNDTGEVVAGLNGTDISKDATHGKVLIFGGSSGVTEDDGIVSPQTVIYEDGTITTNRLVALNGTTLGNLQINVDRFGRSTLTTQKTNPNGTYNSVYAEDYFEFGGSNGDEYEKLRITPIGDPDKFDPNNLLSLVGDSIMPLLYIEQERENRLAARIYGAIELHGDVSAQGDVKIYGTVSGFRYSHRFVSGSDSLTADDHTISISNTKGNTITISLPINPQNGQTYMILKQGLGEAFVQTTDGKNIHRLNYGDGINTGFGEAVGVAFVVYNAADGKWWCSFHKCD